MYRMMIGLCLTLWYLPLAAWADSLPPAMYRRSNIALTEYYVIPHYRQLSVATADLKQAAHAYCSAPGAATRKHLRERFRTALDAWMRVQHLHFGPVEEYMRIYRIFFTPDPRDRAASQTQQLLASGDPDALQADHFRDASVAVQGLPALEYLLWNEVDADADYRCALIVAIADNLHEMASGTLADWQGGEIAFAERVATPGPENPYYSGDRQAALPFLQSLYNGLDWIADVKLKPVLGETVADVDPRQAESWRSTRSLANIVANLESFRALYETEDGFSRILRERTTDPDLDALLRKAFRMTLVNANSIELPLQDAVSDPTVRPQIEKLYTQVRALKQIVRDRLAPALDLQVGFNAKDGD